jgi:hypothetical protein
VLIVSDHESIAGILSSAPRTIYSARLDKVRMALMPYMDKINVVYKPGSKMQNVDPLSRTPAPAVETDAVGSSCESRDDVGREIMWFVR